MISQKTKYGLKAVLFLAKKPTNANVLITEIANEEKIPQKFLEAILLELRKEGILKSKKGKGGGYALERSVKEIMVGDIVKVLEGTVAPDFAVDDNSELNVIIKEMHDAMSQVLDKTSLSDLLEKGQKAQNVVNYMI